MLGFRMFAAFTTETTWPTALTETFPFLLLLDTHPRLSYDIIELSRLTPLIIKWRLSQPPDNLEVNLEASRLISEVA